MALRIILHTLQMIFGNLGQALKVSIGPYLILIVAIVGFFVSAEGVVVTGNSSPGFLIGMLLIVALALFVFGWVAVSWHRFILLEEYTSALPAVSGRPIWPYVGKAILLFLLIFAASIPIFFILSIVAAPALNAPADFNTPAVPFTVLVVFAIAALIMSVLSLRWGVALVGTALGKPMGFFEGWRATKPVSGTIVGVSLILILINIVPSLIISQFSLAAPIIGFILNIILSWITMMMGISILTTLYGHVVENRPLVA